VLHNDGLLYVKETDNVSEACIEPKMLITRMSTRGRAFLASHNHVFDSVSTQTIQQTGMSLPTRV
jgi:hypothetical protein